MYTPEVSTRTIHSQQEDHGLILRNTLNAAINAVQATVLSQLENLPVAFRLRLAERQDVATEVARAFHDQVEIALFGKTGVMQESWGWYNASLRG